MLTAWDSRCWHTQVTQVNNSHEFTTQIRDKCPRVTGLRLLETSRKHLHKPKKPLSRGLTISFEKKTTIVDALICTNVDWSFGNAFKLTNKRHPTSKSQHEDLVMFPVQQTITSFWCEKIAVSPAYKIDVSDPWEFQDPYIGLIYGSYLQFRFLEWPLIRWSKLVKSPPKKNHGKYVQFCLSNFRFSITCQFCRELCLLSCVGFKKESY